MTLHCRPYFTSNRLFAGCIVSAIIVCAFTAIAQTANSTTPATAGSSGENAKPARVVVATVNDKPIYQEDVDRNVAAVLAAQKVDPADVPRLQAAYLQELISTLLLNTFFMSQKGLVTEADLKQAESEFLRGRNMTLQAFLASQKISYDAFRGQLLGPVMMTKYAQSNTTEEGLKKFFEENKYLFDGTERRVSHVLLRPDRPNDEAVERALVEQAKSIRDQITSGAIKFEDAAAKYSAGPSRQRGGDLGYVPVAGLMHPTFTKVVYEIKPDEISEPVKTHFGIHLIKVTGVKEGTKTLEEMKPIVQDAYWQFLIKKLIEDQFNAANIVYAGNYPYFKKGTRDVVMPGQSPTP
jgi:parvulin-like peptidyl-prolyl isomerase